MKQRKRRNKHDGMNKSISKVPQMITQIKLVQVKKYLQRKF
jgi:hypothetical protein